MVLSPAKNCNTLLMFVSLSLLLLIGHLCIPQFNYGYFHRYPLWLFSLHHSISPVAIWLYPCIISNFPLHHMPIPHTSSFIFRCIILATSPTLLEHFSCINFNYSSHTTTPFYSITMASQSIPLH